MLKFGGGRLVDRLVLVATLSLALIGLTPLLWAQAPMTPKIAFVLIKDDGPGPGPGRAEDRQIYTMDPDGRNWRLIVDPIQNIRYIAWSPSGRVIAYSTGNSIVIMDMQGVTVREILGPSPCSGFDWSPDGTRFVLTMQDPPRDPDVCDLWLMNVDGTGRQRITNGQAELFHPRWSPDGRHLACNSTLDWDTYNLIIFDSEGGNERNITELGDSETRPTWAPDGTRLAYVNLAERFGHGLGTIWSKETDGSNARQLTPDFIQDIWWLAWSPDGRNIAYSACDFPFGVSIYVMSADGGDSRRITGQLEPGETLPAWFDPGSLSLRAQGSLPTTWGLVKDLAEQ